MEHHAVSLPPFLFCSTADDEAFAAGIVGAANDELADYVADDPDRLVALGSVPLGWRGAADEARRCLDDLGMAGIAIGSRGAGRDLDDPVNDDLWALLSERERVGVPAPQRRARPAPAGRLLAAQLVGTRWRPRWPSPGSSSAACWSATPWTCASRTAAAACPRCGVGWTWGGTARRSRTPPPAALGVHRPALLRHRRVLRRARRIVCFERHDTVARSHHVGLDRQIVAGWPAGAVACNRIV